MTARPNTMKAVVQSRYGSPDYLELRDMDKPVAGEGEVLVRVRAASVHPDVWHVVVGRPYVMRVMGTGFARPKHPIPGTDMAGVVESVGSAVTAFKPGDAVFGETFTPNAWANGGAYAEYVAVPHDLLASKPDNVTFEQAASVPSSGFITLFNFREARHIPPGYEMLINGAGGGVGAIALQVAKAYGARVTAVDTTGKLDMLRSLGADRVIDYTQRDFRTMRDRYDLIFDVPGDQPFSSFRSALKPEGRYVPIGHDRYGAAGRGTFGLIPHFLKLMFFGRFTKQLRGPPDIPPPTRQETIVHLRELLAAGKLTPIIDSTFPLRRVREAMWHMIRDELHGKVMLSMDGAQ